MTFIWPGMLLGLLLLLPAVHLYRRLQQRRLGQLRALGAMHSASHSQLPALLFLLGIALLLLALARPQMRLNLPRVEGTVILAFDVSNSMLASDLEPTRIDAAKEAARLFVEEQPATVRIGVVAFSNGGLIVQPPTNVRADVLATIARLTPQGATSLGEGIFTALNAISEEPLAIDAEQLAEIRLEGTTPPAVADLGPAVIVLLSDGENTGPPEPLDIAQIAAQANVRIYTIGIGSSEGAVIEVDGFSIVTQLDEQPLQEIADLTNGSYFHAADAATLQQIYDDIDLQLTVRGEQMEVTALFAGVSLLLLLSGGLLSLLWFGRVP